MTTTISEIDLELFESIEPEETCESLLGCDKTPEWLSVQRCCGYDQKLCTPCVEYTKNWMKMYRAIAQCTECKAKNPVLDFLPLGV